MNQEPDKKLMSETEWAELMAQEFKAQGSPVDEVAKARVWRRLEIQTKPVTGSGARPRNLSWAALAAGVVATIGVTHLLRQGSDWREKGGAPAIPTTLTPYVLERDGSTSPAESKVRLGTTVVFRARAAQNGIYALVVSEGGEPPRLAVNEGEKIGADDQLVTKSGAVYGVKIEGSLRACLLAGRDRDGLSQQLQNLNATFGKLAAESCVSLEAHPP
jgi:hypothetical protein